LTFAGHASFWSVIAADMGASLLVIFDLLHDGGMVRVFDTTNERVAQAAKEIIGRQLA